MDVSSRCIALRFSTLQLALELHQSCMGGSQTSHMAPLFPNNAKDGNPNSVSQGLTAFAQAAQSEWEHRTCNRLAG
jgi:hypothetical protein